MTSAEQKKLNYFLGIRNLLCRSNFYRIKLFIVEYFVSYGNRERNTSCKFSRSQKLPATFRFSNISLKISWFFTILSCVLRIVSCVLITSDPVSAPINYLYIFLYVDMKKRTTLDEAVTNNTLEPRRIVAAWSDIKSKVN